ncbi:S-adenosyl-L-methionine-dependent methyltransferase [Schizophyllum commune Tattone D]|nr:S-adenosyl-L-methionine-dependent methyltransferase [Schizophyllum commune Tattone D]
MAAPPSPLRLLADTISQAVNVIDDAFALAGRSYPPLRAPFNADSRSEALFRQEEVAKAVDTILQSCSALVASAGTPHLRVVQKTMGYTTTAALAVAIDGYVAEILRDHPNGLHYKDIALRNGVNADKLGRILRKLASVHIFTEVAPDVFANNRLSSVLDTHKSVQDIQADPVEHFTGSQGIGSYTYKITDADLKSAANLSETLKDPDYGNEDIGEKSALSYTFKTPLGMYDWLEQPGNERRLACFSDAMRAQITSLQPPNAVVLEGFDFSALDPGSKVVDVAGGIGHVTMAIAKQFPGLHFVLEERPAVLDQAKEFWRKELPGASIEFVPQDFFQPQVIQDASVFLLFHILHNWGKTRAVQILQNLREAAGPNTKLIIGDMIIPHASYEQPAVASKIKGADKLLSPISPFLAPGRAEQGTTLDMLMLTDLNGEERTLGRFVDLLRAGGWSIVEVHHIPGAFDSHMVAVPM